MEPNAVKTATDDLADWFGQLATAATGAQAQLLNNVQNQAAAKAPTAPTMKDADFMNMVLVGVVTAIILKVAF